MRKILGIVFVVAMVLTLSSCHVSTGNAACNARVGPLAKADIEGYHFDCTPPQHITDSVPVQVLAVIVYDDDMIYLWPSRTGTGDFMTKTMWHEVGHAVLFRVLNGNVLPHAASEAWADGYAWCAEPIAGMSYLRKPTPAQCPSYLGA